MTLSGRLSVACSCESATGDAGHVPSSRDATPVSCIDTIRHFFLRWLSAELDATLSINLVTSQDQGPVTRSINTRRMGQSASTSAGRDTAPHRASAIQAHRQLENEEHVRRMEAEFLLLHQKLDIMRRTGRQVAGYGRRIDPLHLEKLRNEFAQYGLLLDADDLSKYNPSDGTHRYKYTLCLMPEIIPPGDIGESKGKGKGKEPM